MDVTLESLRSRAAGTRAARLATRFVDWWWGELRELVPARFRVRDASTVSKLVIRQAAGELRCEGRRGEQSFVLPPLPETGAGSAAGRAFAAEIASRIEDPDHAVLLLDEAHVLRVKVELPRAASENLRGVLGFEMDKHTPFRADEVYFDFAQLADDASERELAVELVVVPRRSLDPLLERIGELGIGLSRVGIGAGAHEPCERFDLLPPERGAREREGARLVDRALVATAALLVGAVVATPLVRLEVAASGLATEVESARQRAARVVELREQLASHVAEVEAVMRRKQTRPAVVEVLAELAGVLPDHTWLRALELDDATLRIQGESDAASELIGLLEQSALFEDTSFASPVTRSPSSSKERFEIAARVASKG